MSNRKLMGGTLFLVGFLIPIMQYQYLLRAVGAAASPSAEAAFAHAVHGLLLWNVIFGACSLAFMAAGVCLMLTGIRQSKKANRL